MNMDKLGKYLEKQDRAVKALGYWESASRIFRDYIEECQTLGLDLNDKQVLFPKNLKQAHERTMAQIKFEKNKADQEKFQKAVEKMERYTWEWKGLLIRPARTQEELQAEGAALHHLWVDTAKGLQNRKQWFSLSEKQKNRTSRIIHWNCRTSWSNSAEQNITNHIAQSQKCLNL